VRTSPAQLAADGGPVVRPSGLRDPAILLAAWDAAATARPAARGPAVLAAAGLVDPQLALDTGLGTLGLLAIRCHVQAFGPRVDGMVDCEACGQRLDLDVVLTGLLGDADDPPARTADADLDTGPVVVRAPTPHDLAAAAGTDDPRAALVVRCVHRPGGAAVGPHDLSPADLTVVDAALERLVGVGLVTVRTACPRCGRDVSALLDPGVLLWDRVRVAGRSLMEDVARLAAAFGWREVDVLALPEARRRAYLELADR
jgi:hypothetical protein